MFKFEYDRPRGKRNNKVFYAVTVDNDDTGRTDGMWWYNQDTKMWANDIGKRYSSHHGYNVNCIRSFKRYLRKHPELQVVGIKIVLVPRYRPLDNYGDYTIKAIYTGVKK